MTQESHKPSENLDFPIVGIQRIVITGALLLGTFLSSIEVTVVSTAMPSIVDQLGDLALFPWVFSAYLLAQTVTMPLYGRFADLYGRRKTFIGGVSIFLIGSVLCGISTSMEQLVVFRAVQGLGAGSVLPLTSTIFGDLYDIATRTKLQGIFSIVWGVSSVAGPLTGGAIVSHWSWQWIFLINIPFGLISIVIVGIFLRQKLPKKQPKLDLLGLALLSLATVSLLFALLPEEQRPLFGSSILWIGLALTLGVLFVLQERRHPEPLVPLKLFRDRVHVASNASGVLLGAALFGSISFVPLFIQAILGGSPYQAGAMLIPLSFGWTAAAFYGGRIVRRVGFTILTRLGCLAVSSGCILGLVGLFLNSHIVALLGFIVFGCGMGLTISSFTVAVQERVPVWERGIATALTFFSRSIGASIGIAALGAVMATVSGLNLSEIQGLSSDPEITGRLSDGLHMVFIAITGFAVVASLIGAILFPKIPVQRESEK